MFSLVAYDDSADEDGSSPEEEEEEEDRDSAPEVQRVKAAPVEQSQPVLPSASVMLADGKKVIPGGVFSNPFREAEDAKIASLEKHVKMVDPDKKAGDQMKKVCWSYRKGRCRFGSKCTFAHDSDVILKKELHGNSEDTVEDVMAGSSMEMAANVRKQGFNQNKKKRPGLSRDLVPPKKVLKMYHREKFSGKP